MMGQLTRLQIVTQGAALAAYPVASLGSVVNVQLNALLRKAYVGWPWPFLSRRLEAWPLGQGVRLASFGAGATNGPTVEVREVRDPIFLYDAVRATVGRVRVRELIGGNLLEDETIQDPTRNTGIPFEVKVRQDPSGIWGMWQFAFNPVPDRAYLLAIDHIIQPADIDITSAGDSTKPVYPSDVTLIQMAKVAVLDFAKRRAEYAEALNLMGDMLVNDRLEYGQVAGTNDNIGLDQSVFRGTAPSANWS